ncbi:MAG: thioredoxin family protein [Pirellulales bacterium]|nr:thioredoxin family protein [Pirellulales bacterium]
MHSWLVRLAGGLAVVVVTASALPAADETPPAAEDRQEAAVDEAAQPQPQAASHPLVAESESTTNETSAIGIERRPLRHGVFRWTSYPAAWTAAQKTNRPILLYVTSPGCPHCVKMVSETFQAPHISPLVSESFETVYVDRAVQPELVAKLKVRWFPTTIVVGANNKVIDVLEGYVDPLAFTTRIKTGLAASTTSTQTR